MTGQGCIVLDFGDWMGSIPDGFQVLAVQVQLLSVADWPLDLWTI